MAAVKGPIKISEDLLKKEEFYHEKPLDLEKEVTADAKKYHIVLDENGKETDVCLITHIIQYIQTTILI